ncbi:MAG: hypothetical protein LBR39_08445 [Coriobacteriales bacterium]|jgi:hypothetical protein|nr:hypothetical protein [Coriobacteriales bacterium]
MKKFLRSKLLWLLLLTAVIVAAVAFSLDGLSGRVSSNQAEFVEESVRRSAVQCYAVEGRFPSNEEGVAYLEANYGLSVDYSRYAVYYESMGGNLIPQIRVFGIEK